MTKIRWPRAYSDAPEVEVSAIRHYLTMTIIVGGLIVLPLLAVTLFLFRLWFRR